MMEKNAQAYLKDVQDDIDITPSNNYEDTALNNTTPNDKSQLNSEQGGINQNDSISNNTLQESNENNSENYINGNPQEAGSEVSNDKQFDDSSTIE